MTRLRSAALLATAIFVLASPALADDELPPQPAGENPNTALALQKFDEGRKELEAGNHAAALAAFEASNRLLASPNSLLYMARCHKALGHTASAYTTFRLAYKQSQDRLVATGDKRYVATRDSASKEAATIEADVPKLAIIVPPDVPAGFVLKQNGVPVTRETWGNAVDTDPGKIVIEATGPRLKPFREEVELASAETKRVDVHVSRIPTGTVRVKLGSRPLGLAMRIDGQPIDPNGSTEREVDPGQHTVDVTAPGHKPFRWYNNVVDGDTMDIPVNLEAEAVEGKPRKFTTPRWMFFAAGGTAVAALGVGTILAIDANGRSNDEQDKNAFARSDDERDTIRTESTVANVLFISGAILGIGTGVLAFTTDWKGKEAPPKDAPKEGPKARLTPRTFASGAGLGIEGSF